MFENLEMWIFGTAALVDTVLLFALIERHNWRAVTVWMLLLALGVWIWHVGYFVRLLATDSVGVLADPVRWLSMVGMASGLLLMPSASLHGTFRLLRHGEFRIGPQPDPWLMLCYLPLLLLVPMGLALGVDPSKSLLELLTNYRIPYVMWLCLISGFTSYGLCHIAQRTSDRAARRFYYLLAASMVATAALTTLFVFVLNTLPTVAIALRVIVCLLPTVPAVLFAYFVMRFQLLPLVLERTLVYGAVLTGAMLFHQLVFRRMISPVEQRYRLDIGVIEGALAFTAILLYQPLRRRVAEALQSLVDSSDSRRTDRQRLSVQLAAHASDSKSDLLKWFTETMQRSFNCDRAAGWLSDQHGTVIEKAGSSDLLDDSQVGSILAAMSRDGRQYLTRYSATAPLITEFLDRVRAGAVLQFTHQELSGLFLIGCREWGQPPTEEDLSALALLVEQFGVTLHNSRLLELQVAAEHRFLQQEKLSTLGLIASSVAHEIKNPLSSIKTIIRVMAEELGSDSRHAEDLRMISGEIERLTTSTSELLSAARPVRSDQPETSLKDVLSPTLGLLQHLARQRDVSLAVQFPLEPILVTLDQISLREIAFNLVSNAIDAAGTKGQVSFRCRHEVECLLIEIHDTGPGIDAEQQRRVFEPFYTTKANGSGLGLYIVTRRIRELSGKIECQSGPQTGTTFVLTLPHR